MYPTSDLENMKAMGGRAEVVLYTVLIQVGFLTATSLS